MNLHGALARPTAGEERNRISAHRDPIKVGVWVVALEFVAGAALLGSGRLVAVLGEVQRDGPVADNSARSSVSRPSKAR
jgi:hypothetical protein